MVEKNGLLTKPQEVTLKEGQEHELQLVLKGLSRSPEK